MRIMLAILGEGRGHMTQAIAAKAIVEDAGHQVVSVVLGAGAQRPPPAFFVTDIELPITRIPTLEFRYRDNRQVDLLRTLTGIMRRLPSYWRGIRAIESVVRETQPDVILNFFEPLTGLYALTCRQRPPVVAIAHQFMNGHPNYVRARGLGLQQLGMKWFIRLVGSASTKLALSFYEAPNLPGRRVTVCPPILRRALFDLESNPSGEFVLVYLLNHGYAEEIVDWHLKHPLIKLHCFYDKPGAPVEYCHDETLTFHRLDGEKFLRMLAESKFVVCTAGFECLCEAAYLGKPLFLMPVENHIEQQINAIDATRLGLGVWDSRLNLDRLGELPDRLDNARFRDWFSRADKLLLQALEDAIRETRAGVSCLVRAESAGHAPT